MKPHPKRKGARAQYEIELESYQSPYFKGAGFPPKKIFLENLGRKCAEFLILS